ncbi:hypothetical protein KP003_14210 [Geomonas nitrogeniifigens]|uniref:hypothetical protein n=1 Tax=Geomonas diazotrophica TaxID=2843197 RepID=UPI001C2C27F2|nr:hypothetical protein [Geomonas nitrogeniifigens]QXE85530.1 hypothetical protein KP003_14210 [Geomonas nitrogeniifigens]
MSAIVEITNRWRQILRTEGPDALVFAIRADIVSDPGDVHTRTLLSLGNLWGKEALPLAMAVKRSLDQPAAPVETDRIKELRERLLQREAEHRALAERSEQATVLKKRHEGLLREKALLVDRVALVVGEADGVRAGIAGFVGSGEDAHFTGDLSHLKEKLELLAAEIAKLKEELS